MFNDCKFMILAGGNIAERVTIVSVAGMAVEMVALSALFTCVEVQV